MKNIKFLKSININCTQELAFDLTQDYSQRLSWDTFLKQADLIDGAIEASKGVRAYCVSNNGFGMVTEYVSFNRPHKTAVKMTKGPYLFESFLGTWSFNQLENNITEVSFLYSFKLRFPFTLFSKYILRNLETNVEKRLTDLKAKIESNN